jgi:hypothetical protein
MNRIKTCAVSFELLAELLKTGRKTNALISKGLPQDAIVLRVVNELNYFSIVVHSSEFEQVKPGEIPSMMSIEVQTIAE